MCLIVGVPPENLGSEALEWFPDSRLFPHSNLETWVVGELSDSGGFSVTLASSLSVEGLQL